MVLVRYGAENIIDDGARPGIVMNHSVSNHAYPNHKIEKWPFLQLRYITPISHSPVGLAHLGEVDMQAAGPARLGCGGCLDTEGRVEHGDGAESLAIFMVH